MFTRASLPLLKTFAMAASAAGVATTPLYAAARSEPAPLVLRDPDEIIGKIIARLPAVTLTSGGTDGLTTGFRGQKGSAVAAVEPRTLKEFYQLIMLFSELGVGYLVQGANTSLKGQSTPHGTLDKPVVIIRTLHLKKYYLLDVEGNDEYKVLVAEPGLSSKELAVALDKVKYDLPHKIGSHDFGNTLGGSAATGCGGVRVDNRSGAPSTTHLGHLGVVTLAPSGIIHNGIFRTDLVPSGQQLFDLLDEGEIKAEHVVFPPLDETRNFMARLFEPKSYPIKNHLHDNPYSGQGYEGTQAVAAVMYLIRKKPSKVASYGVFFSDAADKEAFYRDVVFAKGSAHPDSLPILCESMNAKLVAEIIHQGMSFLAAAFLAAAPAWLSEKYTTLLGYRKRLLSLFPSFYLQFESLLGKLLSRVLTPAAIHGGDFEEMLLMQVADRSGSPSNIAEFNTRLEKFLLGHPAAVRVLKIEAGSLDERLVLQIRNVAALATLAINIRERGTLFAFDDAIMPGAMTEAYCQSLAQRLRERFPGIVLQTYLYGHDLKQISHNDWVMSFADGRKLTAAEEHEIHHIQHEEMLKAGGAPHAEHGFGDHAPTDLDRANLVKLVAHRLLNDPEGLANPNGGFDRAYQKAITNPTIVNDAIELARQILRREYAHGTLLRFEDRACETSLHSKFEANTTALRALIADAQAHGFLEPAPSR